MRFLVLFSLFLMVRLALSEATSSPGSPPTPSMGGAVTPSPIPSSNTGSMGIIKTFDENFFNTNPSNNLNTPQGVSPQGRIYDADPDYNSQQREEWLRKCEPYKDQDSKLFRECFQREKDKMRLELRERFDAVERRQGGKIKSYDELLKPNPNSGGFD